MPIVLLSLQLLWTTKGVQKGHGFLRDESMDTPTIDTLESTVECKDMPGYNQTCLFRNAYFSPVSGITLLMREGRPIPNIKVSSWGGPEPGMPVQVKFFSLLEESAFMESGVKVQRFSGDEALRQEVEQHHPQTIPGLSVFFTVQWHQNWAHAMWDGLYPAFVALTKFNRHQQRFTPILEISEQTKGLNCKDPSVQALRMDCSMEETFRIFGSLGDDAGKALKRIEMSRQGVWMKFDELIIGSGHAGEYSSMLHLPGSQPEPHLPPGTDALQLFVDRLYVSHGLASPLDRTNSNQNRPSDQPLRAIITNNKRFTPSMIQEFKELGRQDGNKNVDAVFVDWARVQPFSRQLRLLRDVDIMVSGTGTALFYTLLLPPGSAVVNIGTVDSSGLPSYGEEILAASNRRVNTVYMPLRQVKQGFDSQDVRILLDTAASQIKSGFPVPLPNPHASLSVFGQIMIELTTKSAQTQRALLGLPTNVSSAPSAAEFSCHQRPTGQTSLSDLVYEQRTAGGINLTSACNLDVPLLREMKLKYNLIALTGFEKSCECVVCSVCDTPL